MIFYYTSSKENDVNVFALRGELIDKNQSMVMMQEIEEAVSRNENKILLNLLDLKYLNSSGLNVMINILTKARKAGGEVAICHVNKKINELLIITKLNSVFNVCEDEQKAMDFLGNVK